MPGSHSGPQACFPSTLSLGMGVRLSDTCKPQTTPLAYACGLLHARSIRNPIPTAPVARPHSLYIPPFNHCSALKVCEQANGRLRKETNRVPEITLGQNNSTTARALALCRANTDSILVTPYGPPKPFQSDSWLCTSGVISGSTHRTI